MSPSGQSSLGVVLLGYATRAAQHAGDVYRGDTERTRTQRNALTAFAVRIASAGILYLSQVVLARWMGAFEYGIYVFVWTWVLVLAGVSHLGMPTAMMRLVPEYLERDEPGLLRGLLRAGRAAAFIAGSLIAGLALLLLWLLGDRLTGPYALPFYLAMACVPLCAVSDVQDGIGRGRGWMAVGLVPPYILRPLLLLACMTGAHIAGLPANASIAAASAVVATWVAAAVQMALIARRFRGDVAPVARRYDVARWRRTGLPLMVIAACELTLQNADVLVVSAYLTPPEVGMYFAAAKTMSLVLFVHYAVGSAVANRFAALNVRGDREALEAFVRDAVNWTFWPSLVGAVTILALGKPLLWLFNPQFTEAYPVMFVLAIGFLVRASMGPAEFVLNMLGEQALCAVVLAVSAVLAVALSFALVPVFGMLGAAIATSSALSAAAIMNYVVARRRLELEISIWGGRRGR